MQPQQPRADALAGAPALPPGATWRRARRAAAVVPRVGVGARRRGATAVGFDVVQGPPDRSPGQPEPRAHRPDRIRGDAKGEGEGKREIEPGRGILRPAHSPELPAGSGGAVDGGSRGARSGAGAVWVTALHSLSVYFRER